MRLSGKWLRQKGRGWVRLALPGTGLVFFLSSTRTCSTAQVRSCRDVPPFSGAILIPLLQPLQLGRLLGMSPRQKRTEIFRSMSFPAASFVAFFLSSQPDVCLREGKADWPAADSGWEGALHFSMKGLVDCAAAPPRSNWSRIHCSLPSLGCVSRSWSSCQGGCDCGQERASSSARPE